MITMNNPIPAANPGGTPRKTILVVDDDDAVRRGLRWILVTEGYQVVDAKRSEERRVGKECTIQCRSRWSPYH